MTIFVRTLSCICLVVFSVLANASKLADQRVVFESESPDTEYRLTLGSIKSVNAALVAEREVLVQGRVSRKTVEFVTELKYSEAWRVSQSELIHSPYRELFRCDGLSCGSSNAWANSRFEIKQLYGLDQTQKYRAYIDDEKNEFLVLYFVQRGNKRIYLQIDRIFVTSELVLLAESPSTIASLIDRNGYYSVESSPASTFDAEQVDFITKALKSRPMNQFYLVGHCYSESSQKANVECADLLANKLRDQLTQNGIRERRLDVQSVGELAPRISTTRESAMNTLRSRVELVKKQR